MAQRRLRAKLPQLRQALLGKVTNHQDGQGQEASDSRDPMGLPGDRQAAWLAAPETKLAFHDQRGCHRPFSFLAGIGVPLEAWLLEG